MSEENKPKTIPEKEKEIQAYWENNKIFEKTLEATKNGPAYSFYDGPPFATGTPHYGHLVASIIKDAVPRYFTMKGHYVERRWGWDCHGLPIENIVEKELGFKSKKDIETFGIDQFNETCRSKVLAYVAVWEKTIPRLGRWVDMKNAYKTMDLNFMESVWWVFKELWDKGLVYEGYKSMHICPRCETTLSQQEVSEGYKDISDLSVTAKFELADEPGTFVLAWTTTPWTLPGNVALAVGEEVEYISVESEGVKLILAKVLAEKVLAGKEYKIIKEFKGKDLVGKKYQPLFPYYLEKNYQNIYTIVSADFVTTEDGTGVVHIAPAYGEEDMVLGKEKQLPLIQNVTMSGHFKDEVKDFAGLNVKPAEDTQKTDVEIIRYLAGKSLLFAKEKYTHSYPHCWRCDTPLINYATSSWFVKVTEVKDKALKLAKQINWSPEHIKEGRFGKWLEGARDWSISRQRFWASCMPIWTCACGEVKVFGSAKELEELSGATITDLHKHKIDGITFPCKKCGMPMKRVPDVLDTWFDSGSMPYAQEHYPFENKKKFDDNFPAQFIGEGLDQTRAWFYYLHVIATAIKEKPAFQNVIVNGIVLAEDGKKMSKRLQNYPEPDLVMDKYGADALRYYLLSSPVMAADNLNFSEDGVKEAAQKVVMLTGNILKFYQLYESQLDKKSEPQIDGALDRWLIAKLHQLIAEVSEAMDKYNLPKAVRPIEDFINEFSTWWLRRSRDRFKSEDEKDKQKALKVFNYVLIELAKVMAPFTPFVAEEVYRAVTSNESVHLELWPKADKSLVDEKLLDEMKEVRQLVERGLALRAERNIKIRQPIASLKIKNSELRIKNNEELLKLIKDELNIKEVIFDESIESELELDTNITPELKVEAAVRELVRSINDLRKKGGLTIGDKVKVMWQSQGEIVKQILADEKMLAELKKSVLAEEFVNQENTGKEIDINGEAVKMEIIKV